MYEKIVENRGKLRKIVEKMVDIYGKNMFEKLWENLGNGWKFWLKLWENMKKLYGDLRENYEGNLGKNCREMVNLGKFLGNSRNFCNKLLFFKLTQIRSNALIFHFHLPKITIFCLFWKRMGKYLKN